MKSNVLSIAALFLLLTSSASNASALAEGTEEVRLNGSIVLNTDNGTKVDLELGYGIFVMDYVLAGGYIGYTDDNEITDIYVGGFSELNFDTGTEIVPFVGGEISLHLADLSVEELTDPDTGEVTKPKDSVTAVVLGIYAGSKYFVTDTVAVSGRVLLEAATDDLFVDKSKQTDTNFSVELGFSFFF